MNQVMVAISQKSPLFMRFVTLFHLLARCSLLSLVPCNQQTYVQAADNKRKTKKIGKNTNTIKHLGPVGMLPVRFRLFSGAALFLMGALAVP